MEAGGSEEGLDHLAELAIPQQPVFAAMPVPAIVYAVDTLCILDANESALKLYGYELEKLQALSLLDLCSPGRLDDYSDLAAEFRKPMASIGRLTHRTASNQDLLVSLVSYPYESNGIASRLLTVHDETASHDTEEALRSSEERFRELFENANDVIFLYDLKGKLQEVNRATEYLTGYSRRELLGKGFDELIAPEARCLALDIARAHLGGSAPRHYELPIISKNGDFRFLEISTRIIYRRGHPVAIQCIGRDITERKQDQQRLLESSRELQCKNEELLTALRLAREATQVKEQFLANTSHELRTPMNGIMGMIDLLQNTALTSEQLEYTEAVNQCANDLLTIINDLLDLSQIEARRFSLLDECFDMHESLKSVVKLLGTRAADRSLTLTYEVDAQLPPLVRGDSVRFRQILTNLIANAVKFTQNGGVHILLRLNGNATKVCCEVIDSGIGVEESVRDRIFEAFFQADGTTRRRFGGTGLGLTICKQLVEIMDGKIGLHNNKSGPGTTFWFELPLRRADTTSISSQEDQSWVKIPDSAN